MCFSFFLFFLSVDLSSREVCCSTSFSTQKGKKFNCFKGMHNLSSCCGFLMNVNHIA